MYSHEGEVNPDARCTWPNQTIALKAEWFGCDTKGSGFTSYEWELQHSCRNESGGFCPLAFGLSEHIVCCVGSFHPVPAGVPVGTGQSPHVTPNSSAQCSQAPTPAQSNKLIALNCKHMLEHIYCSMCIVNNQWVTTTQSYSWYSFIYPNYLRVCSQVKLLHSFKQDWREGSVVSENMRFHT